jgi:hypothetical protein
MPPPKFIKVYGLRDTAKEHERFMESLADLSVVSPLLGYQDDMQDYVKKWMEDSPIMKALGAPREYIGTFDVGETREAEPRGFKQEMLGMPWREPFIRDLTDNDAAWIKLRADEAGMEAVPAKKPEPKKSQVPDTRPVRNINFDC